MIEPRGRGWPGINRGGELNFPPLDLDLSRSFETGDNLFPFLVSFFPTCLLLASLLESTLSTLYF